MNRTVINSINLYLNIREKTSITIHQEQSLDIFENYPYYGQYFAFDEYSSIYLTGSDVRDTGNNVLIVKMCLHTEYYSNGECYQLSSILNNTSFGYDNLTIGWQDQSIISWNDLDITDDKQRYISETFWEFNCSARRFGKNCLPCSEYMSQTHVVLIQSYIWDDTNDYVCKAIPLNVIDEPCNQYTNCYDCMFAAGCNYDTGNQWVNQTLNEIESNSLTWQSIASFWEDEDKIDNYGTYWGAEDYVTTYTSDLSVIKPMIQTPQNVICYYEITSNS